MPLKSVIFDWNGTILADAQAVLHASNVTVEHAGGQAMTLERMRETMDIPCNTFYLAHGIAHELHEELGHLFHDHYEPIAAKCRTRSGTRPLLSHLRQRETDAVIASNHTVTGIQMQLIRLRLTDFFSTLLANPNRTDVLRKASKPERIGTYLDQNRIRGRNAIIVGDGPEEIQIGRKFGMQSVAITGGHYSEKRLRQEKPDILVHSLSELLTYLQTI